MTRLLLVDDHQIVIDGLKTLLASSPTSTVVAEALSGAAALEVLRETPVHVALIDINMPGMDGFALCREIKQQFPDTRVIALTMHGEATYINKMIQADVDGYLLKNAGFDELTTAIQSVSVGEGFFSDEVTRSVFRAGGAPGTRAPRKLIQELTRREREVLELISRGQTTDDIAGNLFISPTTVNSHRKNLLRKLEASNTAGLVRAAFESGLLGND